MWLCTLVLQNKNEEKCVDCFSIYIRIIYQLNVSWWRHMNQVRVFHLFAATPLPDIISYPLFANADTVIYSQHPNTTRGVNFRICVTKLGVTNLSHPQTMFAAFWNISAAWKSRISLWSGLYHCTNTVLLGVIGAARKMVGGRGRHCGVLNDIHSSLYLMLLT